MSKQPGRPSQKRRPQARKGRTAVAAKATRKGTDRTAWIIVAVVIAVGGALVFVFASGAKKTTGTQFIPGRKDAPASLVKSVTTIPASTWTKVGTGTATGLPTKLPGPPLVTADGKPRIVYLGAEYCPFCATERWAMVNALSRFGTFSGLKITTSAAVTQSGAPETGPKTPTFSFYGAKYKSDYIQFESVEQEDNSYKPLETPTAEQQGLLTKYDSPPYVDQQSTGAIPFIDFANQYLISGATYDYNVLQGKTHAQVASDMRDTSTAISKGALGSANVITATICATSGDKPANICSDPTIQAIQAQLPTK
jgi:Domain of unknown function (DUF929)